MTRDAWEDAVMRLLDDVYAFASTGPRTSAGWQSDALAVMNREPDDPRGWVTLDWDKEREERTAGRPCYPFVRLSQEELMSRLYPVTAGTATRLLVEMTHEWGPAGTEEQTRAAVADAGTVLDRYGNESSYY